MACTTIRDERERTQQQLLRVLSDQCRRSVLYILSHWRIAGLSELANTIAVQEKERPLTQISSDEVQKVLIDLYHSQIPRLVETGLLCYTDSQENVALTNQGEQALNRLGTALEKDHSSEARCW
ncbi:DUF7344 domain-containing protein [Natronococcus jeotgali]